MRKRAIRSAAVLAAVVATGLLTARFYRGGEPDPAAAAVRDEFRSVVEATGRLEAAVAYEIGPPSIADFWEYNLTWMIPEGKRVKQGDVVARFDTTQIDEHLREHQAQLEKSTQEREKEERNLEITQRQLRLDLVKAEGDLKRSDLDLSVPEGLLPRIEMEQNRLKRDLERRRVAFLGEKIELEKELVKSKLDLLDVKKEFAATKIAYYKQARERFSVQAPIPGVVVYVPKRNGQRWEIGESVWMMAKILQVADVSTLRVEADVLEVDAARIREALPAEFTVDALPGLRLRSHVTQVGQIVHAKSAQDPSRVFQAILPVEGGATPEALRPGMNVRVEIEVARLPGSLTIPLLAVRAGPQGTTVEVVGADGRAETRAVRLGERNRERVVVLEGLQDGERVRLGAAEVRT